jgi:hypothetical protein
MSAVPSTGASRCEEPRDRVVCEYRYVLQHRGLRRAPKISYGSSRPAPAVDEAPNGKYDDGPYDCADKPGALICFIPPHCLAEIGSDESPNNSKDRRQNETRRFIRARVNPFSDNACNEADEDGPKKVHVRPRLYALVENSGFPEVVNIDDLP